VRGAHVTYGRRGRRATITPIRAQLDRLSAPTPTTAHRPGTSSRGLPLILFLAAAGLIIALLLAA